MKKILFLLTIFVTIQLFALEVPKLRKRVNDNADILTPYQEMELEQKLQTVEAKTSSQIAVLTINSLQGENLEDYSMRVAEQWKLGQQEFDNGALLLIALKEKKIRIEVGYGLESIITDLKSGYIIRNLIVPPFKEGNYFKGISAGSIAISGLITEEFEITDEQLQKYQTQQKENKKIHLPFGLIVFLFMIIFGGFGRRRRGGLFTALFLGSMLGGSGRSSSGFGGGGFGGFSGGGGGFGGGGASGGW